MEGGGDKGPTTTVRIRGTLSSDVYVTDPSSEFSATVHMYKRQGSPCRPRSRLMSFVRRGHVSGGFFEKVRNENLYSSVRFSFVDSCRR